MTVDDVIKALPVLKMNEIPAPAYTGTSSKVIGLAVESMRMHTTNEGFELFSGLEHAGATLCGKRLTINDTIVSRILEKTKPGVVVVQDHREWDFGPRDFRDPEAKFLGITSLTNRPDLFKVTILKDAQQRPEWHSYHAKEMDCHAWIIYYNPRIVRALAPYVRGKHLIRTWHSIDPDIVPKFQALGRGGCLLSGAVSNAYPLRKRLFELNLPMVHPARHPGYHRNGCMTPAYLRMLGRHRASICTSSLYGYSLRKIVESTAAGCVVITNLPEDEVMPGDIDDNLVRIPNDITPADMAALVLKILREWDPKRQMAFAEKAIACYDFRKVGERLAADIEALRQGYNNG